VLSQKARQAIVGVQLRTTGQTTLETRRLEVYNILKGFEGTDEIKIFQRRVGSTQRA